MKHTALFEIHKKLGARIIQFAGYEMPVEYSGVNDEHLTVRKFAGLFDVSHMGEIWVRGEKAPDLVQYITTNDIRTLLPGKVQYSCFPNGRGGIVDDLLVYMLSDQEYLLVVNAANIQKDWDWINRQNHAGALLENASDQISQLALQGPSAKAILQKLTDLDLEEIPYYTFSYGTVAGQERVLVSATGYTGAGGFEIYSRNDQAINLWNAIMDTGKHFGIKPAGLASRDTLRLEMGYCLYGNDITDDTSPIEAGLGWITRFSDGNDFIDRPLLARQKAEGPARRLAGFELLERGIPRQHYEIYTREGEQVGEVTSGTMSPSLKNGIGMGYVTPEFAKPESEIFIRIRNRDLPARVVKLPFIKN